MAFTKLTADLNNIQALDNRPNEMDGMSSSALKERFDRAGNTIKAYINGVLTEELDDITIPDVSNFVLTTDSRLSNSRQCNNTFDSWETSRSNLKIGYGTSLPSTGDDGSIFFLYE